MTDEPTETWNEIPPNDESEKRPTDAGTDWRELRPAVVRNGERVAKHRARMLSELRKTRELTQTTVAERLGVSQARVSAIESGEFSATEIKTLAKYISALGGRLKLVAEFGDDEMIIG